jgi:excinuclease ABC subunit B
VEEVRFSTRVADARIEKPKVAERAPAYATGEDLAALIDAMEKEMREAAAALDFETAARLRDQLFDLKAKAAGGAQPGRRAAAAAARGTR